LNGLSFILNTFSALRDEKGIIVLCENIDAVTEHVALLGCAISGEKIESFGEIRHGGYGRMRVVESLQHGGTT
jgi:hypothetical protein